MVGQVLDFSLGIEWYVPFQINTRVLGYYVYYTKYLILRILGYTKKTLFFCACICLYSFDNNLQRLSRWLERMEVRLSTELPESKHGEQEKTTLERVEAFYEEALKERLDIITINEFLCVERFYPCRKCMLGKR